MSALVRPEYLTQALDKTTSHEQKSELERLLVIAHEVQSLEVSSAEASRENLIASGAKPASLRAPRTIAAAAARAEDEIHKLELRKCRRAENASAIIASLIQLVENDIKASEPILKYIDLPANKLLAEQLLIRKRQFHKELVSFLDRWASAA